MATNRIEINRGSHEVFNGVWPESALAGAPGGDFTGFAIDVSDVSPSLVGKITIAWVTANMGTFEMTILPLDFISTIEFADHFRIRLMPTGIPAEARTSDKISVFVK
jgi:hypothetical protein